MAARQWTEEQRKAQAEKIRQHKIWLQSTGPHTEEGKKKCSQNALKTGEYAKNWNKIYFVSSVLNVNDKVNKFLGLCDVRKIGQFFASY